MTHISIPGYELIAKVRDGATATTWKARRSFPDRAVILKILNCDGSPEDKELLDLLLAQTRKAASLTHPGLVRILDVGVNDGVSYVVTEDIDSPTVLDRIKHGSCLCDKEALDIAGQCAKALGYAWDAAQLFHGNLKPDNILIAKDGTVMISDLGLTAIGEVSDNVTGGPRRIYLGTPNYMSPEQIRGIVTLDARADIYSLGASLYHLVTGTIPFADTSGEAVMSRQLNDQVPNPKTVNPEVSVGMTCLLTRMMAKDRDDRYPSWAALSSDIKRIRSGRIYVQKEGRTVPSTVSPAQETVTAAVRRAHRRESPLVFIVSVIKWVAVLALWTLLARELLT